MGDKASVAAIICAGLVALGLVAAITFGTLEGGRRKTDLVKTCIQKGGQPIMTQYNQFQTCLQRGDK